MDKALFGRVVDAPLDANGEQQCERLAERMRRFTDLLIEASPRNRTQQTAAAIAAQTGAVVRTAAELDEVDFGRWAGRSFVELHEDAEWRRWNEQRGVARTPAGEGMFELKERIVGRMQKLAALHPSCDVALVTHAELIRAALLHFLGAPFEHYARLEISPASISTLTFDGASVIVQGVNERADA